MSPTTWEHFASLARDWMKRLPPVEARAALAALLAATVANYREVDLDEAIALALRAEPAPVPKAEPEAPPAPKRQPRKSRRATVLMPTSVQGLRGRPSKRAQALVRQQLAHGPRRGEEVQAAAEAAEISEHTLIAAADALGVRTRKGQWWLPGVSTAIGQNQDRLKSVSNLSRSLMRLADGYLAAICASA